MNIRTNTSSSVFKPLSIGEIESIQSLAENILDSIHSIKAGIECLKGYLLKIDDDGNICVVREIDVKFEKNQ